MFCSYDVHYKEKKLSAQYVVLNRKMSRTLVFRSGYSLSGTCRQNVTVEWRWLKIFMARSFCISVSFVSTADKFVKSGWRTGRPSPTTVTFNWIHSIIFNFCMWSNLAWNSSSSLAIYFCILSHRGLQFPLRESIRFHFDIGKMTECLCQYISLKNLILFWKLMWVHCLCYQIA